MRSSLVFALILCASASAPTGCGPKNTDPKPIDVTNDPRLQPNVQDGKLQKAKAETQGNLPPD
jgi:hypothetical protein